MDLPRVSRGEAAFMIGMPLAWAALLLLHPGGEADEVYASLQDEVANGFSVHVGMLIFIPLMAGVIYLLLRGVEGTAAQVARWALVPFVVFYSAWEVLQGIANSILVDKVNGLSGTEQATGIELVQDFAESPLARDLGVFALIGTWAFIAAMIAAGIALRRHAGAPASVLVLLVLAGFLITAHPPPFGPTGLVLFVVAVLLFWRSQSAAVREPVPA